eukprot:4007711-Prymnesium_polylepis.1
MHVRAATLTLVVVLLDSAAGFYLPGVAPIDYADGARVDLKVGPARRRVCACPWQRACSAGPLGLLRAGEQAYVHQDSAAVRVVLPPILPARGDCLQGGEPRRGDARRQGVRHAPGARPEAAHRARVCAVAVHCRRRSAGTQRGGWGDGRSLGVRATRQ